MSVRSLTRRLSEERSEAQRRAPEASILDPVEDVPSVTDDEPTALFKGRRPEPEEEPVEEETPKSTGLKPRLETPPADIPGGIAARFSLRSQRVSEISRSIDAITIELQSN
ncbi:TPA: hypothetical protein DCE37_12415 [Candidatus Latescibacteria bacterium]|nr:hypothetical protein [Candidatus Latescibacterota bacterium]